MRELPIKVFFTEVFEAFKLKKISATSVVAGIKYKRPKSSNNKNVAQKRSLFSCRKFNSYRNEYFPPVIVKICSISLLKIRRHQTTSKITPSRKWGNSIWSMEAPNVHLPMKWCMKNLSVKLSTLRKIPPHLLLIGNELFPSNMFLNCFWEGLIVR